MSLKFALAPNTLPNVRYVLENGREKFEIFE